MKTWIIVASLAALSCAGCAESDSSKIGSEEIYANFTITGKGSSVDCKAALYVGGIPGTLLDLSGNDALLCGLGSVTTRFKGSSGSYIATGLPYEEAKDYQVVFARGKGQCVDEDEQHISVAMLPAAITIASPANGSTHSKSSDLTITWAGSTADEIRVSLVGEELNDSQQKVPALYQETSEDDGSVTISKAKFANWISASGMKITIDRVNKGAHAASLKGGSTIAVQTHAIDVNLSGTKGDEAADQFLPLSSMVIPHDVSRSREVGEHLTDAQPSRLCGQIR